MGYHKLANAKYAGNLSPLLFKTVLTKGIEDIAKAVYSVRPVNP